MSEYYLLYFVVAGVFCVMAIAFHMTWRLNIQERGTRDWAIYAAIIAIGTITVSIGFLLNAQTAPAQGNWSKGLWYIGTVANGTAFYFLWRGVRRFLGKPEIPGITAVNTLLICVLCVGAHAFLGLPESTLAMMISFLIATFSSLIFAVFYGSTQLHKSLRRIMLGTFGYTAFMWGARGISLLIEPTRDHHSMLDSFVIFMSIMISILNAFGLMLLTNERLLKQLRTQATRDPLTGLLNRRAFLDISNSLIAHASRHQKSMGVAMLDLDHFKQVNDELGHLAGDKALKRFGELLRQCVREEDTVCRYGGEEFVALLPAVTAEELNKILERIRTLVAQQDNTQLPTTVSIGSYLCPPDQLDLQEMLATADNALYKAKRAGRNRVTIVTPTKTAPA